MLWEPVLTARSSPAKAIRKQRKIGISEIISTQSLDVPTVSGATFSSNSILNAVADALGTGSPSAEQPADNESNSGTDQPEADGGNGQGQTGGGRHGNGWRGGLWRRTPGKGKLTA